ncbi:MAG: asparagine synthase (glutamine-hydrolyzing) [Acidobacteriota bacterium]
MCGIAGVIGHPDAVALTARIATAQAHRGPDGFAVEALAAGAALGHRRLAILDLSPRGAQPMTSRDGRWTMVLNGEIFNYRELREQLPDIPWRSATDTEVLLEAVARWGLETALGRSIGMFAVALWDRHEHALTLARDRIGEKPLVYFWNGRTLAFASELKALAPLHDSRIDRAALDLYLALGYVPAPLSIFRNLHKLEAGHWLRLHEGSIAIRRWWFPEKVSTALVPPEQRSQQLRGLIGDAVRLRLRSDVPIALALSGGIDSSILAAELGRQGAAPTAFTVVFEGDQTDLPYARRVARHFGLRHEIVHAEGTKLEYGLAAAVAQAVAHYDEPFADSSSIASLALAQAVGARYKVILEGDGGDEAFGGYRHYEFIAAKQTVKAMAAAVGLRDGCASVYVESKTSFRTAEREILLDGNGRPQPALERFLTRHPFAASAGASPLKRALWSDRHLALANGLTYKMDTALAAHSIEGRAPLLDHRVIEWAQNLDDHDLVRGREKKVLLRQAYAPYLPPEILARPKHGFGAPIAQWLSGPLRKLVAHALPCPLLEPRLQRGLSGQRQWAVLTLALWAKHWGATW